MENERDAANQSLEQTGQTPSGQSMPVAANPKHHYVRIGLLLLLIFVFIGFGGYVIGKQLSNPAVSSPYPVSTIVPTTLPVDAPAPEWQTHTGAGFRLKYPDNWKNLQSECQQILIEKSDAIALELGMNDYIRQKWNIADEGALGEIINAAGRDNAYAVAFDQLAPKEPNDIVILGPQGVGELNNIFIRGPEGSGFYQIKVNYAGPAPDTQKVCMGSKAYEYKQILSTFTFLNQNTSDSSWQTHINAIASYEVQYPRGWRAIAIGVIGEGYGPDEVGEDILWAVNVYDKNVYTLEKLALEFGEQFSDRKQIRSDIAINSIPAVQFITTTATIPDWYLESIVIDHGANFIVMYNGAIKDENLQKMQYIPSGTTFERFYSSFRFVMP